MPSSPIEPAFMSPLPRITMSSRPRRVRSRSRRDKPRTTSKPSRNLLSHDENWYSVYPKTRQSNVHTTQLHPESCPALVLNADFSPLSYMPLSLWPWQDVIKAVFLDRVTVVATYDIGVRSPRAIFPLPSVISLKEYQPVANRKPAFSRFNVFMRDGFSCQYCGERFSTQELTFDHVVPRCCEGKTNWSNVVTACIKCNHRKGRFLLTELKDMKLKRLPYQPSHAELQANAKMFPPQYLHESWRDYVYWSQSMEEESDKDCESFWFLKDTQVMSPVKELTFP